jgi:hypothetical protein
VKVITLSWTLIPRYEFGFVGRQVVLGDRGQVVARGRFEKIPRHAEEIFRESARRRQRQLERQRAEFRQRD